MVERSRRQRIVCSPIPILRPMFKAEMVRACRRVRCPLKSKPKSALGLPLNSFFWVQEDGSFGKVLAVQTPGPEFEPLTSV